MTKNKNEEPEGSAFLALLDITVAAVTAAVTVDFAKSAIRNIKGLWKKALS